MGKQERKRTVATFAFLAPPYSLQPIAYSLVLIFAFCFLPFLLLPTAYSLKPLAFLISPYSKCISTVPWPISSAISSSEY
jgi:hypothetical protein